MHNYKFTRFIGKQNGEQLTIPTGKDDIISDDYIYYCISATPHALFC